MDNDEVKLKGLLHSSGVRCLQVEKDKYAGQVLYLQRGIGESVNMAVLINDGLIPGADFTHVMVIPHLPEIRALQIQHG